MNRNFFEQDFLGKMVEIRLFNGEKVKGFLYKTQDEKFKNNPNLYLPRNWYFVTESKDSTECSSCLFRLSHVKGAKIL